MNCYLASYKIFGAEEAKETELSKSFTTKFFDHVISVDN